MANVDANTDADVVVTHAIPMTSKMYSFVKSTWPNYYMSVRSNCYEFEHCMKIITKIRELEAPFRQHLVSVRANRRPDRPNPDGLQPHPLLPAPDISLTPKEIGHFLEVLTDIMHICKYNCAEVLDMELDVELSHEQQIALSIENFKAFEHYTTYQCCNILAKYLQSYLGENA